MSTKSPVNYFNNFSKPVSRLRHEDKATLVRMCIAKENDGWECIRPIELTSISNGNWDRRGRSYEYKGAQYHQLYEATYQLKVKDREVEAQ